MAILGIDYGQKRVGLALAADGGRPHRLEVVEGGAGLERRLKDIATRNGVQLVVVGLPRNLDGDDTSWTHEVRQFAAGLEKSLGLQVALQDEADTTNVARTRLEEERVKESELPKLVDAEAAVVILEDYLW